MAAHSHPDVGVRGIEDSPDCHNGGQGQGTLGLPWQGDRRAGEKTRLAQYVRHAPEGTPLSVVVRDVFGGDVGAGDADYQLARRFFAQHSGFFKTDSRGGLTWIEPRVGLFTGLNLRPQYAKHKTSVRRGDGTDGLSNGDDHPDITVENNADSPQYPKDRVGAILDRYLRFQSDNVKQSFLREFVTERVEIEDKWQVFERVRGTGDDYLCLPYRTRHSDAGRAGDVRDGFEDALQSAGQSHRDAVVMTVTTDPKEHDSLTGALDSLRKNKTRLMSWLSTEYQLGYRPDNLTTLEFSRDGLPHYHIVLFGVSWAVSQDRLSGQWQSYGQGRIVDCRTAETHRDGTEWLLHDDDQGTVSLSYYLGKAIRGLEDIAEMDVDELEDLVESGDVSLWRQILYWATGKQYYTCSPSLKRPTGDDDLPHVTEWEFVGAAQYGDLPAHVRQEASFDGLPPPGTDSRTRYSRH